MFVVFCCCFLVLGFALAAVMRKSGRPVPSFLRFLSLEALSLRSDQPQTAEELDDHSQDSQERLASLAGTVGLWQERAVGLEMALGR